jgi:hypothetical protein
MAMRIGWPARQRVESRPRVARAVEAARLVREGIMSDQASAGARRHFEAVERAAATGPLKKVMRRAAHGLSSQLVWETARAAQQAGRRPEEVWAEALGNWLTAQEMTPALAGVPRPVELRRQAVWGEIEDTLRMLRAS